MRGNTVQRFSAFSAPGLGRMMTNASPARLAQLQRRAQAAQAGAEGIPKRLASCIAASEQPK